MKRQVPLTGEESFRREQPAAKLSHSIDWRPINNGHAIKVCVHGDIDAELMKQWRQLLRETAHNGIDQFEFDLHDSEHLSLAGLAMLILFKERKNAGSRDISLNHCNRELCQTLNWCGLDRQFIVRPRRGH